MRVLDKATPERLSMFSDGVFAVLITVLVLDLHPPELPTFKAFISLWPTWLSYAVSYLFIAIVMGQSPLPHALRYGSNPSSALVQFRPSVFHVAASARYSLDGREPTGTAAGCLLCSSILPRKRYLHRIDLGAY